MTDLERKVSFRSPMPQGYEFLAKGDMYKTGLCRRLTLAAHRPLYVVYKKRNKVGLRAPKNIIKQVCIEEKATREKRSDAVKKTDLDTRKKFDKVVTAMFPKIPPKDLTKVLDRALKKRSGRVGRTGTLDSESKAHLAVQAHVRHTFTNYDQLLKSCTKRVARDTIRPTVEETLKKWGGSAREPSQMMAAKQGRRRHSKRRRSKKELAIRVAENINGSQPSIAREKEQTSRKAKSKAKNGLKITNKEKSTASLVTESRRHTRNSNPPNSQLNTIHDLIVISSDESEESDQEGSEEEEEEGTEFSDGESGESFIVEDGLHSDSFTDEDWDSEEEL